MKIMKEKGPEIIINVIRKGKERVLCLSLQLWKVRNSSISLTHHSNFQLLPAMAAAADLEDVPSVDLMTELLRRMKCATKPDKRLILIGALSYPHNSLPPFAFLFSLRV